MEKDWDRRLLLDDMLEISLVITGQNNVENLSCLGYSNMYLVAVQAVRWNQREGPAEEACKDSEYLVNLF